MADIFDHAAINQVQQANDIVDVISEHVSLTKKGREMVGLCPFHDDHSPSFSVSPAKQIFKCFPCGAGGDVIKFIQMRENLSFAQALERLAERAGIQIQMPKYKCWYVWKEATWYLKQSEAGVDWKPLGKATTSLSGLECRSTGCVSFALVEMFEPATELSSCGPAHE